MLKYIRIILIIIIIIILLSCGYFNRNTYKYSFYYSIGNNNIVNHVSLDFIHVYNVMYATIAPGSSLYMIGCDNATAFRSVYDVVKCL